MIAAVKHRVTFGVDVPRYDPPTSSITAAVSAATIEILVGTSEMAVDPVRVTASPDANATGHGVSAGPPMNRKARRAAAARTRSSPDRSRSPRSR